MALAAHLGLLIEATLLLERLVDGGHGSVGIGTGEVQGGFALLELLRGGVMAVGAADGVDDLGATLGPHPLEVAILALLVDDAGHVRSLAAPARHGQGAILGGLGGTGAQALPHVGQGVEVTARFVVILGEGVAGPEHHHLGILGQGVGALPALAGRLPAVELIGVILGKQLAASLDLALDLIGLCPTAGAQQGGQ
ncbi:hypothetical protein D3C78_881310 [compost metagenome]